jgi:hypothetical protein
VNRVPALTSPGRAPARTHTPPATGPRRAPADFGSAPQVLALAAVITPNQDIAFMIAIAWTAVNLLMSK